MARKSKTKRTHVTPGVYYKETVVPYATKSLGITKMGLAGETLKGPAFQPIQIGDWSEFQAYFGGTSTEKYRGSQYPKYELPYIAKEFLKNSEHLEVVRTLGLSGVNAGPAWVITATNSVTVEGKSYKQVKTNDGEPVEAPVPTVSDNEEIEDGITATSHASFSVPSFRTEDMNQPSPISVIDAYANGDLGIMYFDDAAEDYYTILPEAIKLKYKTFEELKEAQTVRSQTEEGENIALKPFMYIGLDNGIKSGKISLVYIGNDEVKVVKTIEFKTVEEGGQVIEKEDDYGNTYYALKIDQTDLPDLDFVVGRFSVYQYGWNDEEMNRCLVKASGKAYQYKLSEEVEKHDKEDADDGFNNTAIAVLRSRGEHKKAVQTGVDNCGNPIFTYDAIEYYADSVSLKPSSTLTLGDGCNPGYSSDTGDFRADASNYGRFTIVVKSSRGCSPCEDGNYITKEYSVSLNPEDKNYITKVIGTNPEVGDADIYVEELYDVALEQLILSDKVNTINHELAYYPPVSIIPDHAPVNDLLSADPRDLTRKDIGKRYIYTYSESSDNGLKVRVTTDNGVTWSDEQMGIVGHIYTVASRINDETGKREYFYGEYRDTNGNNIEAGNGRKHFTEYLTIHQYNMDVVKNDGILRNCVKVLSDNNIYILKGFSDMMTHNDGEVVPITLDFNDYREPYRYASTPWIVSELKGSGENIKLHKLFRFHTISDGSNASYEAKVSIENIDPENEVFDVVIRSFSDIDSSPVVLERFQKCSLVPGTPNYLGYKVGTFDEQYSVKSAYVTVEINEDDITASSIPCGFLGYPVRNYKGVGIYEVTDGSLSTEVKQPYIMYNNTVDEDTKIRKQYFGMSDIVGIDEDMLSYKGADSYSDDPEYLTPCFHLDARILNGKPTGQVDGNWYVENKFAVDSEGNKVKQIVDVDGVTGYTWVTVAMTETTNAGIEPRIGLEDTMQGTIYEDKAYRKFTVCFYGGWDGWDYYRTSRSNGDEYRYNKYKGSINTVSGQGQMFNIITNPEEYGFDADSKIINSDYYAYLAAVKQLDNPKTVDISLLATPGIDYVNQTSLVQDVIDIVEDERGDALYIVTTPDKPYGAGDGKAEMYTPEDAVYNLEATDIDTNYACTYYPWVKYFDGDNSQYIYLPVTCDVARNMAYTDNVFYPWYAAAGWNRGDVTGTEPKRKLKLAEQDTLYEGRINFVNSFAKEGNRIWGDKNLQVNDDIMNRISKRRLLIRLKTLLSNACVGLLFDPNDAAMADSLRSAIKSVLDPIMKSRGISDYYIRVDDSAEARDRLELPAVIGIKPVQMLEYITIDLAVTPQGVNWE